LRGSIAAGVDVCAERRAVRRQRVQAPEPDTVEHIFEQFKMRHLSSRRSGKEVGDILEREVVSRWGKRLASEIRRVDVIELLDEIADRGTVYMRNRVAAHVRKLWNFAIGRGIERVNPAARIEMLDERARDRVLSTDELRLFWRACDKIGAPFGPLFKLLLVTGQRRDEVGTLERSEVDVGAKSWLIPPVKTKITSSIRCRSPRSP
jgi:integrase